MIFYQLSAKLCNLQLKNDSDFLIRLKVGIFFIRVLNLLEQITKKFCLKKN